MGDKTDKARKCPWCNEVSVPEIKSSKKTYGDVTERRCSSCGKILAAYLEAEGDFFPKIRSY
jgi:phage FluMu protein Com